MATITKAEMLNLFKQHLVTDPVNTGDKVFAYLDASLHGTYNDTVVSCDL